MTQLSLNSWQLLTRMWVYYEDNQNWLFLPVVLLAGKLKPVMMPISVTVLKWVIWIFLDASQIITAAPLDNRFFSIYNMDEGSLHEGEIATWQQLGLAESWPIMTEKAVWAGLQSLTLSNSDWLTEIHWHEPFINANDDTPPPLIMETAWMAQSAGEQLVCRINMANCLLKTRSMLALVWERKRDQLTSNKCTGCIPN